MILTHAQRQELQALLGPSVKLQASDTPTPYLQTPELRMSFYIESDGLSASYYLPTTNCCHPPAFDFDGSILDLARKLAGAIC
jgi:hypothetical protein